MKDKIKKRFKKILKEKNFIAIVYGEKGNSMFLNTLKADEGIIDTLEKLSNTR